MKNAKESLEMLPQVQRFALGGMVERNNHGNRKYL
jgi:hypothetical protein